MDDYRPNWIDFSKVFMIYLVVLGHYTTTMELPFKPTGLYHIMKIITLFHMPFFFIVSGYLYKKISVMKTIEKGWVQLLKPYVIMCTISCLVMVAISVFLHHFSIDNCINLFIGIITSSDGLHGAWNWSSPLWFCYSLFLIKIVVSLFQNTENKIIKWILGGVLVIGSILVLYLGECMPFHFDSSLIGLTFFLIGYFCKNLISKLIKLPVLKKFVLIVLLLFLLVISASINLDFYNKGDLSINANRYGPYPLSFIISGVSGSLMIILIMTFVHINNNCLRSMILRISNGTIVVLGFHWAIYKLFFWWISSYSIIIAICVALLNLSICYILILLSSKYCKAILGNRSLT